MTKIDYSLLKDHFNNIICGDYPVSSSYEPIRDTYKVSFDINLNLFEVYRTYIKHQTNPINSIITLIGPLDKQKKVIPSGIVMATNTIYSVNVLSSEVYKGLDNENIESYTNTVYEAMQNVVFMDQVFMVKNLYSNYSKECSKDPLFSFIKGIPLYFTYHHIKDSAPEMLDLNLFKKLIGDDMVADDSNKDRIIESISSTKYSTDPEIIYSIITCKGSINLF